MSKLDYLKKYLAKPGEADDAQGSSKAKEKKKRKKSAPGEAQTIQIRDLSEVLPAARRTGDAAEGLGKSSKLLSLGVLDEDEERLARDGELEFVDEDAVVEAQKKTAADVEKSGVKWKISNHRTQPPKKALRAPATAGRAHVIKEEGSGDDDADLFPSPAKDLSPPRTSRQPEAAEGGDSDLSPPRGGQSTAAPVRGGRRVAAPGSDDDLSPPRAAPQPNPDSDLSPPRQSASPPRRGIAATARRKRQDSDADLSPPRKPANSQRQRHDSDADLSPPRKPANSQRQRHDSDADLSPPRKPAESKRQRHDSDADLSPPRKLSKSKRQRHDSDADLSPPRRGSAGRADADKNGEADDNTERMSSGLRAGLVSGQQLKDEAREVREKRRAEIEAAPDAVTGRGAETVYRNRQGQRVTREEWVEGQQKKRKKKVSEYPEQELEWGGGLKQRANKEEEMEELSRIAAQPFARYEMDEKGVQWLQDKNAWNDPMKNFKDDDAAPSSASAAAAAAEEERKKKPKCPHAPWNNRFGILPGYRWDGKVRGSDFEKRWLMEKNGRAYKKIEQYKWESSFD
mmetsp:Transcript_132943/g.230086  ORF Transcript_132943/g.230086 Transcript_132943/m.230086 type:complete len:570 (+) Transcript_132943:59-1768(+)